MWGVIKTVTNSVNCFYGNLIPTFAAKYFLPFWSVWVTWFCVIKHVCLSAWHGKNVNIGHTAQTFQPVYSRQPFLLAPLTISSLHNFLLAWPWLKVSNSAETKICPVHFPGNAFQLMKMNLDKLLKKFKLKIIIASENSLIKYAALLRASQNFNVGVCANDYGPISDLVWWQSFLNFKYWCGMISFKATGAH